MDGQSCTPVCDANTQTMAYDGPPYGGDWILGDALPNAIHCHQHPHRHTEMNGKAQTNARVCLDSVYGVLYWVVVYGAWVGGTQMTPACIPISAMAGGGVTS